MEELSYREVPPTDGEILGVLVDHFDVTPEEAAVLLRRVDPLTAYLDYQRAHGAATTQEQQ